MESQVVTGNNIQSLEFTELANFPAYNIQYISIPSEFILYCKLIQFKVESRLASDMVKYSLLTRRYQYNINLRKILCAGFGRGFLPPPHHKVQAQTLYKQSKL